MRKQLQSSDQSAEVRNLLNERTELERENKDLLDRNAHQRDQISKLKSDHEAEIEELKKQVEDAEETKTRQEEAQEKQLMELQAELLGAQ